MTRHEYKRQNGNRRHIKRLFYGEMRARIHIAYHAIWYAYEKKTYFITMMSLNVTLLWKIEDRLSAYIYIYIHLQLCDCL